MKKIITLRVLLLIIVAITAGCIHKKIKEENYTIPLVELENNLPHYHSVNDFFLSEKIYNSIVQTKYTCRSQYKIFNNTDIEIEFQKTYRVSVDGYSYTRRKNYLLGVKNLPDNTNRAFYIVWTNRSPFMDTAQKVITFGRERKVAQYFEHIPWDIGKYTDSLQSNLSYKEIKQLYPAFKGFFKKVQIDSIIVRSYDDLFSRDVIDNPAFYSHGNSMGPFFIN